MDSTTAAIILQKAFRKFKVRSCVQKTLAKYLEIAEACDGDTSLAMSLIPHLLISLKTEQTNQQNDKEIEKSFITDQLSSCILSDPILERTYGVDELESHEDCLKAHPSEMNSNDENINSEIIVDDHPEYSQPILNSFTSEDPTKDIHYETEISANKYGQHDLEKLYKLRGDEIIELLWLQQAIKSRKSCLSYRLNQ